MVEFAVGRWGRIVWIAQLAVNASGAAVVAWHQYEGAKSHVYAAYREAAAAGWTSRERVAPDATSLSEVGIDDAGRVLLLFSPTDKAPA